MKVFVVDDQRLSRASIIEMVKWEEKGLAFAGEYANGKEAYHAILEYPPDIVITDVRMPLIDGLQLTQLVGEHGLNTSFIIVSGFDEYEYVRRSVQLDVYDYILKPVDQMELDQAIDRVIKNRLKMLQEEMNTLNRMRENFFYSFLESSFDPNEDMDDNLAEINFGSRNSKFAAILFDKISDDAKKWLKNAFSHEDTIFLNYRGVHLLVISVDHLSHNDILATIQQANKNFACGQVYTGPLIDRIQQLPASIKLAFDSFMMQQSLPEHERKQVATFGEIDQLTLSRLTFNRDLETEWLLMIQRENWEQAKRILHRILDLFIENNYPNPHLIDGFFSYILLKGINKLYEKQIIDEQQFLNACEITKEIPLYLEPVQKKELVISFFSSAFTSSSRATKIEIVKSIQSAKQYIDDHYVEDISLTDLAAQYYVSPGYFSSMFKQFVGMNFIDYLTELRMDYASQLLKNSSELKIYEIAKLSGYNDVKYFRQQFKRFFDQTPQEYKEEHTCLTT